MLPVHTISKHPYQLNQDTTYSVSLGNELNLSKGVVLETLFLKSTKFLKLYGVLGNTVTRLR